MYDWVMIVSGGAGTDIYGPYSSAEVMEAVKYFRLNPPKWAIEDRHFVDIRQIDTYE